jgi:hypothetical protein
MKSILLDRGDAKTNRETPYIKKHQIEIKKHVVDNKKPTSSMNFIIWFSVFFFLFILVIPYLLYKNNYFYILAAYMPNLDLIANVLTWHSTQFNDKYKFWEYLYPSLPITTKGFVSQTIINYFALLGVTFLVARETNKTNSLHKGWSIAIIMLLMTYLLPGRFISWLMGYTKGLLSNADKYSNFTTSTLSALIGTIVTIIIIYLESMIIHRYKKNLDKFASIIIKTPRSVMKII